MSTSHAKVDLTSQVRDALSGVDDPELPGVGIVELGLVESVDVDTAGRVRVGLIPTFSGCPALAVIRTDVAGALAGVPGVSSVEVEFLETPVWTIARVSEAARGLLASRLGIAVTTRDGSSPTCTVCGAETSEVSAFGPTRCRAVHRCTRCGEVVEVMRR